MLDNRNVAAHPHVERMRPDTLVMLVLLPGIAVLGLLLAVLMPMAMQQPVRFAWMTLALYAGGVASFVAAKISVVRRGVLVSFGSAPMSPGNRRLYRLGYVLMGTGLAFTMLSVE